EGDMGVLVDMVGTLRQEAFTKLTAIREVKKSQIENYFKKSLLDMEIFARSQDVTALYSKLVEYHKATDVKADGPYDVTTPEYHAIWEKDGKNVLQYYKDGGVYDVFMICAAHGHVMYTCAKESDMGTNLTHGPYKDSHLAKLCEKVVKTDGTAMTDFEPYAPSNGDPAVFAGAPIRDEEGKIVGIMAVQLPLEQINAIMMARDGLGETGETYLVGQDQLMRSDSFLDPENHT
ncbi:MAG: methyl-accepting chemotaxis protein, partial [bacterium]|nr:methyl-accepting chemotaxis protein [bacterium]